MQIREVTYDDISKWLSLAHEYDKYVKELVPDLIEWYNGSQTSISFENYMNAKILQHEAFIVTCKNNQDCFGITAISIKNNRITFFGISHNCDFMKIGEQLLSYSLNLLNSNADIFVNIIKSKEKQIQKQYELFDKFGFLYYSDGLENGVPVNIMIKKS